MSEAITPHWHEHNPWKGRLFYVSLEELAEAYAGPAYDQSWVDRYWRQFGDQLDAYVLPGLDGLSIHAGVRYGPNGPDYLTPKCSAAKLWALAEKHNFGRLAHAEA